MPTPYLTPVWANEGEKLYEERVAWEKKESTGCWIGASNVLPGNIYKYVEKSVIIDFNINNY